MRVLESRKKVCLPKSRTQALADASLQDLSLHSARPLQTLSQTQESQLRVFPLS